LKSSSSFNEIDLIEDFKGFELSLEKLFELFKWSIEIGFNRSLEIIADPMFLSHSSIEKGLFLENRLRELNSEKKRLCLV
jgi:hypothetical protein